MSCNVPVVSTDVGNVKEMLTGAQNCFISSSQDPVELANLCFQAIEKKSDLRSLIFEKKLDIESKAQQLKQIYISILNN